MSRIREELCRKFVEKYGVVITYNERFVSSCYESSTVWDFFPSLEIGGQNRKTTNQVKLHWMQLLWLDRISPNLNFGDFTYRELRWMYNYILNKEKDNRNLYQQLANKKRNSIMLSLNKESYDEET